MSDRLTENTRLIRQKALELGFSACGFSPAGTLDGDAAILDNWLDKGFHAGMKWMENHRELRKDPRLLVPGSKTVISLLLDYYNPQMQHDEAAPVVSRYAYGKDYHKVIRKKMRLLMDYLFSLYPSASGRMFVDSAPVLEHAWARNSGLGWIGKNSLLLNRDSGSYFFISEIITDQELEYDRMEMKDLCGSCSLCVDECPTHAINQDRTVNSGKCLSYLTIENRDELPPELKSAFYNRVFGCDICQDVCPWNRKLSLHNTPDLMPLPGLLELTKQEWTSLSEKDFILLFEESPLKRAGFSGLRRNIDFLG